MARRALIGHTGFVGSNIAAQLDVDECFNSRTLPDIDGREFDLVVSAANRAEMWRINADPEPDWREISDFMEHLATVRIGHLVLISSVGVYATTSGVDEDTELSEAGLAPYGVHRLRLERFCRERFDCTVVRLPGLFGPGLKKNALYDMIHAHQLDQVFAEARYQYYDLGRIGRDLMLAVEAGLDVVNLACPPVSNAEVAQRCFDLELPPAPAGRRVADWDVRTKHGEVFGGSGGYVMSHAEEMRRIEEFVTSQRGSGRDSRQDAQRGTS